MESISKQSKLNYIVVEFTEFNAVNLTYIFIREFAKFIKKRLKVKLSHEMINLSPSLVQL